MATDSMMPFVTADTLRTHLADLSASSRDGTQMWGVSTRVVLGAAQALGGATLAFWQCRTKSGLETARRLAECRSSEVLLEIQMDHAKATIQGYADHLARVGAIVGQATLGGWGAVPTTRALAPVPSRGESAA